MDNVFDIHTHKLKPYSIYSPFTLDDVSSGSPYLSLGIHPWRLANIQDIKSELVLLINRCEEYKDILKAIGETGLDTTISTTMEEQMDVFKQHVALSEKLKLPLIIHCVKAFELLKQLKNQLSPAQAWIIHDFRKKAELAKQLVNQEFYLSLSPNILKLKVEELKKYPNHNLFFETDESDIEIQKSFSFYCKAKEKEENELLKLLNISITQVFKIDLST